jgi:CMP-N-acetylneuraminic acid synthetase
VSKYALIRDERLKKMAEKHGIKVIERSKESCEVDGPLNKVFEDLKQIPETYCMFLNPCLYALKPRTIQAAIEEFRKSTEEYATSVKPFKNWVWDTIGNKPVVKIDFKTLNTKEIQGYVQAAHCFHIFNKEEFLKTGKMLNDPLLLLQLPEDETLDVDTAEDYNYARWRISQKIIGDDKLCLLRR